MLGKEEPAFRKRPEDEVEQRITLPCTVNGQIASGEVNRYRFEARKGQRLLLPWEPGPFIAASRLRWFQPVMALYDAAGQGGGYDDDYRFKPDPVIFFKCPKTVSTLSRSPTPCTAAARISSIASPSANCRL